MNNDPDQVEAVAKPSFWRRYGWSVLLVGCVCGVAVLCTPIVRDWWQGWFYSPEAEVVEMRAELDLTARGNRIFNATHPALEDSEVFNQVCNSHNADITLLGCYTEGKIYVYEIKEDQLRAANKVTMAHEFLHAVWERLSAWERNQVEGWLNEVYEGRKEWFDGELETYDDADRLEEIYARAGTKLEDLPDDLERHYAKYFRERVRIVAYYQEYEAPFLELRLKLEELVAQIEQAKIEIDRERAEYMDGVQQLDEKITWFNQCAATAGCFQSQAEFARQRSELLAERTSLEEVRTRLNEKIIDNNTKIEEYRAIQQSLGRLNDAMNSNIELLEEAQDI